MQGGGCVGWGKEVKKWNEKARTSKDLLVVVTAFS
jgi:hypothetical protein